MTKMKQTLKFMPLILVLGSCSTLPSGPSVLVLPGSGKTFAHFQDDDMKCRQFAHGQIASAPHKPDSKEQGQQYYDIGYIQCMYVKGHYVPVSGTLMDNSRPEWTVPPPPDMPPPQ
jgi:hypothetical protein